MPPRLRVAQDLAYGRWRRVRLRLEVASAREPVTGVVRVPDGTPREFTGWPELFAVLAKVLPGQAPRRARDGR